MPLSVTCPNCDARLTFPDEVAGKRVKCKKCDEPFVARRPRAGDEDEAPRKKPVRRPADDEDEDEAPRKKPAKAARRARDDEDDEPRPRKKGKGQSGKGKKAKSPVGLIVLLAVGFLVLAGGGIGAYFLFGSKKLPGDGMEVVPIDMATWEGIETNRPGVRDGLKGKVVEIDLRAIGLKTIDKEFIDLELVPREALADRPAIADVNFAGHFPFSDRRNARLKDLKDNGAHVGKVRGIVATVSAASQPYPKVDIRLDPAWVVEDVKPGKAPPPSTPKTSPQAVDTTTWVEVHDEVGRYRIKFPEKPESKTQDWLGPNGKAYRVTDFRYSGKGGSIHCTFRALPSESKGKTEDEILDMIEKREFQLATRPFTHQGFKGREVVEKPPGGSKEGFLGRVLLAKDRVILLTITSDQYEPDSPRVKAIMETLKIE